MSESVIRNDPIGFFTPIYVKVACGLLLLVLATVVVGPHITAWEYDAIHWEAIGVSPSGEHWFGTDNVGRDLFARTMMGGRISLLIAVLATTVSFCIGLPWGAVSGFVGGTTDQVMMRIVDGMYAIPYVLIVIVLVVMLGRNIYLLFIAIGAVSWLDVSRIVRGQALVLRAAPFVASARAMGLPEFRIVVRHVVPNVLGSAIVFATLMIPSVIISESFIQLSRIRRTRTDDKLGGTYRRWQQEYLCLTLATRVPDRFSNGSVTPHDHTRRETSSDGDRGRTFVDVIRSCRLQ